MSLPTITIRVIDHTRQRYSTVGDWFFETTQEGERLVISVSKMNDWRYEFLVATHELCEVFICRHQGISQKQVDRFDMDYEKKRKPGNFDEPGDDPKAPYRNSHCIASGVERILAAALLVCWKDYCDKVESL